MHVKPHARKKRSRRYMPHLICYICRRLNTTLGYLEKAREQNLFDEEKDWDSQY